MENFSFLKLKPKAGKVKKEGKEKRCINDKIIIFFLEFLNYHINPTNSPGTLHFMKEGHWFRAYSVVNQQLPNHLD